MSERSGLNSKSPTWLARSFWDSHPFLPSSTRTILSQGGLFFIHPRENDISRMLLTKYHWYIYIIYIYISSSALLTERPHSFARTSPRQGCDAFFAQINSRQSDITWIQRLTKNPMKKDSMWKNRHRNTYFIIFHHHIYTYVIFFIYLIYLNLHHDRGDLGPRAARWQALDGAKALFSPAVQRFAWRSSRTMECWQDMTGATQKKHQMLRGAVQNAKSYL